MKSDPHDGSTPLLPEALDAAADPDVVLPKWVDVTSQSLLDAAPDAMLVVNRAGEIVVANGQAETALRSHSCGVDWTVSGVANTVETSG